MVASYIRTEEMKKRNSERQKGLTLEVRYGKEKADRIKNNQRIARYKRKELLGYLNSPETRKKLANEKDQSIISLVNILLKKLEER